MEIERNEILESFILRTAEGISIYFDEYQINSFKDNEIENDIIFKLQGKTIGSIVFNNEIKKEFLEEMEEFQEDEIDPNLYYPNEDISEEIKICWDQKESLTLAKGINVFQKEYYEVIYIDNSFSTKEFKTLKEARKYIKNLAEEVGEEHKGYWEKKAKECRIIKIKKYFKVIN